MKRIIVAAFVLLSAGSVSAQQKIINRYGLELVRVKGGYSLLDGERIAVEGIFDTASAPADMYEPYSAPRS